VLVELDGGRWRTVPLDVAARVGLAVGLELDRERLRTLRRELRRAAAIETGARTLARRDRSEQGLRRLLERRGVPAAEREEAVAILRSVGAVDDGRYAAVRAAALAERGLGDAAILFDLEREGIAVTQAREALDGLEPERDRATRLATRRGGDARTARWLARRGFTADSIEEVLPGIAESGAAELG
jgi:SOS response regulatory protein OraA/RecX